MNCEMHCWKALRTVESNTPPAIQSLYELSGCAALRWMKTIISETLQSVSFQHFCLCWPDLSGFSKAEKMSLNLPRSMEVTRLVTRALERTLVWPWIVYLT